MDIDLDAEMVDAMAALAPLPGDKEVPMDIGEMALAGDIIAAPVQLHLGFSSPALASHMRSQKRILWLEAGKRQAENKLSDLRRRFLYVCMCVRIAVLNTYASVVRSLSKYCKLIAAPYLVSCLAVCISKLASHVLSHAEVFHG